MKNYWKRVKEHDLYNMVWAMTVLIFLGFGGNKSIKTTEDYFIICFITVGGMWLLFLLNNFIFYIFRKK